MRIKVIIKLIVSLIILGILFWGWQYIHQKGRFPVENVKVEGTYHFVSQSNLREILLPEITQGFFNIDVDQLQNQLALLPGIKSASIRRSWPNTIYVSLTEYKPIAYFNNDQLITENGFIFKPQVMNDLKPMPKFFTTKVHAKLIIKTDEQLNQLAKENKLSINQISFIGNQWIVDLSDGLNITLGSEKINVRFEKLLKVLPQIMANNKPVQLIDMRYSNGFAVKWAKN